MLIVLRRVQYGGKSMRLKRPLFMPGRRIEQIGKLSEQPFFSRRPSDAHGSPSSRAGLARRGLLPRLAENAGALFSATLSVILAVALVALVVAFIRELRQDSVLLETFVAPRELVEQGYTSTVIAEKMLDEIRAINRRSGSVRARRALEFGDAVPDIQIAHGGLSMKSIVRYARRLFDLPDATIGGEIVRRGASLRMTIRTRDRHGTEVVEVVRDDANADALLQRRRTCDRPRHRPVHPCNVFQLEGIGCGLGDFPGDARRHRLRADASARE